jgi:hypothetical protein
MSHPASLGRVLATLDPEGIEVISHLLTCVECAARFRDDLGDAAGAALTTQELASLEGLEGRMTRQLEDLARFVTRLKRKKRSPVHFLVRSRLECLIADRLAPALRELESISETARGNFDLGELR